MDTPDKRATPWKSQISQDPGWQDVSGDFSHGSKRKPQRGPLQVFWSIFSFTNRVFLGTLVLTHAHMFPHPLKTGLGSALIQRNCLPKCEKKRVIGWDEFFGSNDVEWVSWAGRSF